MVNQTAQGKNDCGRTPCGRSARHKDAKKCAVGGAAFHLECRFYVTNEFEDMTAEDWCDNKKWFDIKFLARSLSLESRPKTSIEKGQGEGK